MHTVREALVNTVFISPDLLLPDNSDLNPANHEIWPPPVPIGLYVRRGKCRAAFRPIREYFFNPIWNNRS